MTSIHRWFSGCMLGMLLIIPTQAAIVSFDNVNATVTTPDDYNYNPDTGNGTYNDPGASIVELDVNGSNADFHTGSGWEVALHTSGMFAYEGALQLAFNAAISAATGAWSTWGFLAAGVFAQNAHTIGDTWYYALRRDEGGGNYGYGWVEIERNAADTWTILGSGYNSQGEILAGEQGSSGGGGEGGGEGSAVPEPNVISFFLIGGFALYYARNERLRRARAARAAA